MNLYLPTTSSEASAASATNKEKLGGRGSRRAVAEPARVPMNLYLPTTSSEASAASATDETMNAASVQGGQNLHPSLVQYFRDCLAAQLEWSRSVNVLEQKDVFLVPLSASEQTQLGRESSLRLSHPQAIELGKRAATGGSDVSLTLGALFLVGRRPSSAEKPERRFCAALRSPPHHTTRTG